MPRLFVSLALFSIISTGLTWTPPEKFDDAYFEEQNRNAECDNHCWSTSFPGGSCTDDAACMCTQQKYREKYFCCMGKQCAPSVLPDSIERQDSNCEAFGKPYTFDSEAVCGIKLPVSSWVAPTVTVTVTSIGPTPSSPSSSGLSNVAEVSSPGASSPTGALTTTTTANANTPTASTTPPLNGASTERVMLNGLGALLLASVVLLW